MNSYFQSKGFIINGILNLSPKEALEECKHGAIIIDMRREFEYAYKQFDVDKTFYMKADSIKENFEDIAKDKPLIIADQAGVHSKEIVKFLMEKGFENVANLIGGIFEWDKDGLPLKIDNKEMLSGACLCVLRKKK
jgi:rhodanese-related sulfurtransferase